MLGIKEEYKNTNPSELSPLTLAFIGDTVFDLLIRGNLVMQANRAAGKLTQEASKKVCAPAQSEAYLKIAEHLNDDEADIYRRGRNAHTGKIPKNATPAQYHSATGLEALFGWLYLMGRNDRIEELFSMISL